MLCVCIAEYKSLIRYPLCPHTHMSPPNGNASFIFLFFIFKADNKEGAIRPRERRGDGDKGLLALLSIRKGY